MLFSEEMTTLEISRALQRLLNDKEGRLVKLWQSWELKAKIAQLTGAVEYTDCTSLTKSVDNRLLAVDQFLMIFITFLLK